MVELRILALECDMDVGDAGVASSKACPDRGVTGISLRYPAVMSCLQRIMLLLELTVTFCLL